VAALKRAFCHGRLGFHGDLTLLAQPKTFSSWLRKLWSTRNVPSGGQNMCSTTWAVTLIA
jgi:hypothetical protein